MINKNEWYRFSQNKGGHAIDFMKEFYGFSFAEAVKELLGEEGAGETNRRTGKEDAVLWSSIFVTLMANKIGGLQFGIYRNCQISSRVFHTAVAALPLTKANRSDFE